jgi:hypothetical protein
LVGPPDLSSRRTAGQEVRQPAEQHQVGSEERELSDLTDGPGGSQLANGVPSVHGGQERSVHGGQDCRQIRLG